MRITKRQLIRIIREERRRLHEEDECGETCKKLGAEAMAMAVYGLSVSEGGKQALADLTEWLGEAPHDAAKWLIDWTCDGLSGWDSWGEHAGTVGKVCSGLGKAGTMPLAIQEKAFWAMAKGIELLPLSMIRDFTADTWPDTQGGKLALADQKKAAKKKGKKKTEKIEDKSTETKETKTKQEGRAFKISQRHLRNIIKEAISSTPTGKVEVEWDFHLDDDTDWNQRPYEVKKELSGIPDVVQIPDDIMAEFQADAAEYGESQAEQLITDWLSDETGWLHQGWSWV